jgi:hypothetical protein
MARAKGRRSERATRSKRVIVKVREVDVMRVAMKGRDEALYFQGNDGCFEATLVRRLEGWEATSENWGAA